MNNTANITKRSLKIKISLKPGAESCKSAQLVFKKEGCGQSLTANNTFETKKSHNLMPASSYGCSGTADLHVKSSTVASKKRRLLEAEDHQKVKKRRMDRKITMQCSTILKQLLDHRSAWLFREPVDPVKLKIPDYFSVISEPMDLGTIRTKLDKNRYSSVEEFASDVRLTFSNAMLYNPPSNNVHQVAKELNKTFNTRFKCLEAKWNLEQKITEQEHISSGRATSAWNLEQKITEQEHISSGRATSADKAAGNEYKTSPSGVNLLPQKPMPAEKAKTAKKAEDGGRQCCEKNVQKGAANSRTASGSVNVKPRSLDPIRCCSCGNLKCQCSLHSNLARPSSSDLSSDVSIGPDHSRAPRKDHETKTLSATHMSKSDPDSDGAVSALDEEHFCSTPQRSTVATSAVSGEDWTPAIDIQLSPKKALRAAMLKSRFAETIFKAKVANHVEKIDPMKMQQEKERLERQHREEKARIEAKIMADEAALRRRAEAELKMKREREREAFRLALQKMEKTVEINENVEVLKDLEMLGACCSGLTVNCCGDEDGEVVLDPLGRSPMGNPLERLGLFIKKDYLVDDDEDEDTDNLNGNDEKDYLVDQEEDEEDTNIPNGNEEEGEIIS